jgi:hypothetical protein
MYYFILQLCSVWRREFNTVMDEKTTQFDGASYLGQLKCEKSYSLIVRFTFFAMLTRMKCLSEVCTRFRATQCTCSSSQVSWYNISKTIARQITIWTRYIARATNAGLERLSIEVSRCAISSMYSLGICRVLDVASAPRTPGSGYSGTAPACWWCWREPGAR